MKRLLILIGFCINFNVIANSNQWEGVPLTPFSLADQSGELRTNKDYNGRWLVLYFYPKDQTPGCTVEAQAFTRDYAKYQALNSEIVGVSYDDVESHKEFAEIHELPFSLLADTEKMLTKSLKVDKIFPWPHASRQTFLVDPKGVIVKHFADVSPKTHSEELLKAIEIFQTKD